MMTRLKDLLYNQGYFEKWRLVAAAGTKGLQLLRRISPVAWQHIYFQGHFTFSKENEIDLDEIIQQLTLHRILVWLYCE